MTMKAILLLIALLIGFAAAGTSDYRVATDMAAEFAPITIAGEQP